MSHYELHGRATVHDVFLILTAIWPNVSCPEASNRSTSPQSKLGEYGATIRSIRQYVVNILVLSSIFLIFVGVVSGRTVHVLLHQSFSAGIFYGKAMIFEFNLKLQ